MRSNPKYNNICAVRIGMYREEACYNCLKLSECDQHYDDDTGDWDYPVFEIIKECAQYSPVKLHVIPGGVYDREISPGSYP